MMTHIQLREIYRKFWLSNGHREIPSAPLVLSEDPTTLFTSSGMQKLVPYLTGETHPLGTRVFDIQRCIRTQDIEEVGDNRHDTFFEMMGNWSFGDYFKQEQLPWVYDLFTNHYQLPKDRLYVSIFEGDSSVPRDEESETIWKKLGVKEDHIYAYGVKKNWWSRSGTPDKMPAHEIGGPDSEIFNDFGTPHNPAFGETCHPNCDCGRFMEIGNSVFIQYRKKQDGTLEELPQKNVDFGGGIERILAAIQNNPDIFMTDVFEQIVHAVEEKTNTPYDTDQHKYALRVIADHIKTATFLVSDGVRPANKLQGYILRRLIRRAAIKAHLLGLPIQNLPSISTISQSVIETYKNIAFGSDTNESEINSVVAEEIKRFGTSIERGLNEIHRSTDISGKFAFDLYQNFGFPPEITGEVLHEKGKSLNWDAFYSEFNKHKELSRSSSAGMFKGGLADHGEKTVRYHTATHLLHQALNDLIGGGVRQEGSNITGERLRFDFTAPRRLSEEDRAQLTEMVNEKINESLPVAFIIMKKDEAIQAGAKSFFREKYPDQVKVYYIGGDLASAYSKELCGGPHVSNTKEIGSLEIFKYEKIGSNLYRIYAR